MRSEHPKPGTRHFRRAGQALVFIASAALFACSPYPYSDTTQTLGTKTDALDTSYAAANKRIAGERRLHKRVEWVSSRPRLDFGPGCEVDAINGVEVCDLVVAASPAPAVSSSPAAAASTTLAPASATSAVDVCRVQVEGVSTPTPITVKALKPPQREDVFVSLKNYTAALQAITKAQDRADFDTAAGKTSAAVGGLVQSATLASGAAAPAAPLVGAVAKASTDVALWLIGQALDYQRLQELQAATEKACEPVHALAVAVAYILEEQRGNELQELRRQLAWDTRSVNQLRRRGSAQSYGAAIDAAEASADAFQSVRNTDPDALANALRDSHDNLVLAVRNNSGERDALIASLSAFSKYVGQLETAANGFSISLCGKAPIGDSSWQNPPHLRRLTMLLRP